MSGQVVLVVEDNADQSSAMIKALQDAGFSPLGVDGITGAIFKLKNQKVSCIVLDLVLGEGNGAALIELVRTRKDLPNSDTPILVVSANLNKETLKGMAGKIQGAIAKPFDMKTFVSHVQRLAK